MIVEVGLWKTLAEILANQLERRGGKRIKKLDPSTTHVLIDKKLCVERVEKYLCVKDMPKDVAIVDSDWLSTCLSEGKLVAVDEYILREDKSSDTASASELRKSRVEEIVSDVVGTEEKHSDPFNVDVEMGTGGETMGTSTVVSRSPVKYSVLGPQHRRGDDGSDYTDSGDEESKSDRSPVVSPNVSPEKLQTSLVCTQASTSNQGNHNQFITDKLQVLATAYANTKDQWRALGYKKAIASVKNHPKKLETWEECNNLPFVSATC